MSKLGSIYLSTIELGDKTYIELVKKGLQNPDWAFTAVRITTALAKHGDYSGIPVLQQLASKEPETKSGTQKFFGAMAGEKDNSKTEKQRISRLRIQIADAMAKMNRKDGVPVLNQLLSDKDIYVQSSAAYALAKMTNPAALGGLEKALSVDYGKVNGNSRNPVIHAHIVRNAALNFPKEPQSKIIAKIATESKIPSVKFLALAVQ